MSNGPQVFPPPPQAQYGTQVKGSNSLAVAGFVLAVLATLGSFIPLVNMLFAFLAILALILGIIGLIKSASCGTGKGLSIAAIILAVVAVVISVMVTGAGINWLINKIKSVETGQSVPAAVTGTIGEPVKDGKFTFVVTSVNCGMTTYRGSLPTAPLGEFCAVDVTASNHGKGTKMWNEITVEGFIAGTRYVQHSEATMKANPDAPETIGAGISINKVVLIDIPVGKRLDTVELHDFPLSEGTSVSLT